MGALLVLPTLNEEQGLAFLLGEMLQDQSYDDLDMLVVDGHSEDATVEVASLHGIKVVQQRGQGKGAAFRTAIEVFLAGPWDALAMIDADGSYPPASVLAMLMLLEDHPVVVGDRLSGALEKGAMSRLNLLGNHLLSACASLLHGATASDVCSGCWVMRRDVVEDLRLNSVGFEIEAELFSSLIGAGYRPHWVPIPYRTRHGEAKLISMFDGVRILRKLLVRRLVIARKTEL